MERSNQGSAIASVLIFSAASLVTLTMFLGLILDLRSDSILIRRKLVLVQVREHIADLIKSDVSWQAMSKPAANSSFDCFHNLGMVCPDGGSDLPGYQPFQLLHADGLAAYPPPSEGPGFTEFGEPCAGASTQAGAGNDACPFAILARWRRDCGSILPCQDVYADVRIDFVYNPSTARSDIALNMTPYSFRSIRSPFTGSVLARRTYELAPVVSAQGYSLAESAFYKETAANFTIYLPPEIPAATLHITATGIASLDAGAQRPTLIAQNKYSFRTHSLLCAIVDEPVTNCLLNPSQVSALDSSSPEYYTPGNGSLITGNVALIRSIPGSATPHDIRSLFRVKVLLPQATPVWPQIDRLRVEYTVYR